MVTLSTREYEAITFVDSFMLILKILGCIVEYFFRKNFSNLSRSSFWVTDPPFTLTTIESIKKCGESMRYEGV